MKTHVIFSLIILFVLVTVETRKKKKKTKTETKAENPLDRRPASITPEHYCDSCIAIIKEMTKLLRGKKKESDVFDVLDEACNPELYNVYSSPPPQMREGCEIFISGWREELENVLIGRPDDETPIHKLCYEQSQACVGVDPKNVKPYDDEMFIDGQPVKIGAKNEEL
jgi:hypothetical protein